MTNNFAQYQNEINHFRHAGDINRAIEICRKAIAEYPSGNYFYKVLGDLYLQDDDCKSAAKAYLEQLKRLQQKPEHFKAFARFYRLLSSKVSTEFLAQYRQEIVAAIKEGEIADNIHQLLIRNFGNDFITDKELQELLVKSDRDKYFWEIKQFAENAPDDSVRAMIIYQSRKDSSGQNMKIKEFLISVAEKRGMYQEALGLIGNLLSVQKRPNPTTIRTLLRISRKQQDYTYAEQILVINEDLIEKSDFNIQYELVYYFSSIRNSDLLEQTLKMMQRSATSSIPIARTLYNFYLIFNRFEYAQLLSEHIQKLTEEQRRRRRQERQFQSHQEEQLESEQAVWQTMKDLVSEQEHNRQMIAIRDLLKGFSHELGQPITNIRYMVQLQQMKIQRGKGTAEEIDRLLISILEQTARIGTLLERFQPIVSSKSTMTLFSINACIKQVFSDLSDRLKESGIEYMIEEKASPFAFGDQVQFSQVFYNLVLNSMQAIKNQGKIYVQISESTDNIKIIFTDNGPGIPKENHKKIFEPFFSTKDPTAGNGGEGLGLFIVWNILRMHQGTIRLNEHYQKGAQFIIQIPVKGDEP